MRIALGQAILAGCFLFPLAAQGAGNEAASGVTLLPAPASEAYPDAAAPDALRFACAQKPETLGPFFAARGLRFEPDLVRKYKRFPSCHICYEPTVPGFKVLPEDAPVAGLMADIDPLGFVTNRTEKIGDSLDIVKAVLSSLPRPLDVTLGLSNEYDSKHWPAAQEFHFGDTPHTLQLRGNNVDGMHPWVQDYLKSGWANGKRRLLVTRHLYEGRNSDADKFGSILDGLERDGARRSKLSWEGGDFQFAADPKDPSRTVLFYGNTAKLYWGAELTDQEYGYVVQTEFGSDGLLDLSTLTPHVDYFVAFLPGARTAIVSQRDRENLPISRAALDLLMKVYAGREPADLRILADQFSGFGRHFEGDPERSRQLIAGLKRTLPTIPQPIDPLVAESIDRVVARFCPKDEMACFTPEGKRTLVREAPEEARLLVNTAVKMADAREMAQKLLALIEMQLPDAPMPDPSKADARVRAIERMGFNVIRVPRFPGGPGGDHWPGISYVNLLLVDKTLFVPTFGLGKAEDDILAKLAKQLPEGYNLEPVYARHALMYNGGVHCSFGIFRSRPGVGRARGDLASTSSE
jgi:hypothetical protein